MSKFFIFLAGLVVGVLGIAAVSVAFAPSMMIHEHQSPYGLDETVEKISQNAIAAGWVVSGVKQLDKSVEKHGGGKILPVRLIDLCQANHAAKILSQDDERFVSVMMPCTISVYEKQDGKVYIAHVNAGLMGRLFGGTISEVMGGPVSDEQNQFVSFAH
ncbi:DUF302 domain-containing protein [Thiocapsa bogorovii]|uniref:DUF302 domain-containing protein n=1 Tax=Thiocapsa bogorovii TaxID=521689 RepID=UPI001E3B0F78|nr:DUF302 domain-containing protein [Thiocapsa bogorovii]UHD17272.1 DUF302 domain-containing protein [Thiocapsa bogorovii]